MKKLVSIIIAILLMGQTAFAVDYGAEYKNQPEKEYLQTFMDVKQTYWAFEFISEMAERGVLNGYPNGYFYPENSVTRAEFAKIMTVAASLSVSKPQQKVFRDVDINEWYAPFIHTAYNYLSGFNYADGMYYLPETNALREDIAVALVKLKGYDTTGADVSMLKTMFTDYSSISESAKIYVATALEKGLISGYSDNTFRGQNTITRAEAATLLWRAYQYGNENKSFDNITDMGVTNETTKVPEKKPVETSMPSIQGEPQETPPAPIVKDAEIDTIFSGDNPISYFCPESENSGFFITYQKVDFETWMDTVYYFSGTEAKKIADYSTFGSMEWECDDGNIPVQCYPGNSYIEDYYISAPKKLTLVLKGDVYSETDSSGTADAYVTLTISADGEIEVNDVQEKSKSNINIRNISGKSNGRMYNRIDGKIYSYDSTKNLIYCNDLINGGEKSIKVESGIPASRLAGLWDNGFGVLSDKTFYTLSADGTHKPFYQISEGLNILDGKSMQKIEEFYIYDNSVYIFSDKKSTLRLLKKLD